MFKNILIVLLILYIIYKIIFSNNNKNIKKPIINKLVKKNKIIEKKKKPSFGADQFVPTNGYVKGVFKFQDIELIKKNKILEITDPIKKINNIPNDKHINNKGIFKKKSELPIKKYNLEAPKYKGMYKNTDLPCQKDEIYDAQFFKSSKQNEDQMKAMAIDPENYKNKSIKEVYESMIIDYKKILPTKEIQHVDEVNNVLSLNSNKGDLIFDPFLSNVANF